MRLLKVSKEDAGKYTCLVHISLDGKNYTSARSIQMSVNTGESIVSFELLLLIILPSLCSFTWFRAHFYCCASNKHAWTVKALRIIALRSCRPTEGNCGFWKPLRLHISHSDFFFTSHLSFLVFCVCIILCSIIFCYTYYFFHLYRVHLWPSANHKDPSVRSNDRWSGQVTLEHKL